MDQRFAGTASRQNGKNLPEAANYCRRGLHIFEARTYLKGVRPG